MEAFSWAKVDNGDQSLSRSWVSWKCRNNTMFNACVKADQKSIKLKTLVEHDERDNISLNSVSSACAVDKQQEKELVIFRLMWREVCWEKASESTVVLLNAPSQETSRCDYFATGGDGLCNGTRVVSITTCVNYGTRCNSTTIIQFKSWEFNQCQVVQQCYKCVVVSEMLLTIDWKKFVKAGWELEV